MADDNIGFLPDKKTSDDVGFQPEVSFPSLSQLIRNIKNPPSVDIRTLTVPKSNALASYETPFQEPPEGVITRLPKAIVGDAAAGIGMAFNPKDAAFYASQSGNIPAAFSPAERAYPYAPQPLPIEKTVADVSKDRSNITAATLGKLSLGVASTAPFLAIGGLPSVVQKAVVAGFTADMAKNLPKTARELGTELGKDEKDQDPDKISSLVSDAIQQLVFAAAGAKNIEGAGREAVSQGLVNKYVPRGQGINPKFSKTPENPFPKFPPETISPPVSGSSLNIPRGAIPPQKPSTAGTQPAKAVTGEPTTPPVATGQITKAESDELLALRKKDLSEDGLAKDEEQRMYELSRKEMRSKRAAQTSKLAAKLKEQGIEIPDSFLHPSDGVENHIHSWTYNHRNGMMQIRVERHTDASMSGRLITVKAGDVLTDGMDDSKVGTTRYREANPDSALRAGEKPQTPPGQPKPVEPRKEEIQNAQPQLPKAEEKGIVPEPPTGEKLVTVKRPDGTTYQASFGGKFWDFTAQGRGKVPSIAVLKEGKWSHGTLPPGDVIEGLEQPKPADLPKTEITQPAVSANPTEMKRPEKVLESSDKVKVGLPSGATVIRVTTNYKGRDIENVVSKKDLERGNVFKGAGVTKVEAGTIGRGNKFLPIEGEISISPKMDPRFRDLGAALYGGGKYPSLQQLTDSMSVLAKQTPQTSGIPTAFDFGKTFSQLSNRANGAINGLRAVGQYLKSKFEGYPQWTEFKAAVGDRHLALTQSVKNAEEFVNESKKTVPSELSQEAISDYMDAGGDDNILAKAESETKPAYKAGYAKARNLTAEEKAIADNAKDYFNQRLQDAIDNGILEDGIEDYIHRLYQKDTPLKMAILSELRSGIFTGRPALAKQRVYEYDYEAEKAGLTPIKSFIKRIAAYDLSLNKAIADRQIVKSMTQIKMPDGRPMVDVGGVGVKIEPSEGVKPATLIKPSVKTKDENNPKNDRGDYKSRDYPALKKWKWVGTGEDGQPILLQGDVLIHPDALRMVDPLFKRSAIRQNPVGRAALSVGSTVKQTMLDLSGFHPTQITVHGWEHRTFKPVTKIDFDNQDVSGLIRGGMVVGETTGHELFSEGLSGGGASLTRHIPLIGEKLQSYNHWFFNSYIPRLKVATGLHALERNRQRYPNLTNDELYYLTANQMNNAFGELNYEMIGRSKTTQDVMRLALLAPDFLEARSRFVAAAATRYGREQFTALALGAATLYITARIINKLLDGEYHSEPKNAFSVIYNKKAYSLRTVQGDLLRAATEPGQFIYSRLNPVYGRTLMEFFSGRDYFGRQRSGLQQFKDFGSEIVPISLRGLVNPREQNLWESFLNAFGITEHRSTATDTVYELADNFKKANNIATEPGEFMYDSDKDPYRGIKEAATFSNIQTTAKEIDKAVKSGHSKEAVWKHFTEYSHRPFTGSKKNDARFYDQLSPDNKKIYEDAVKERQDARQKFEAAWELEFQNKK